MAQKSSLSLFALEISKPKQGITVLHRLLMSISVIDPYGSCLLPGEFPNADEFSAPFGRINSMAAGLQPKSCPESQWQEIRHDTTFGSFDIPPYA